MREILFRGKTVCDGDWVYGGITWNPSRKKVFIHTKSDECEVIPETVGQYTGLTDKNKKKIFEGDIIFDPEMKENHIAMFDEGGLCTEEMFLQSYLCFDEMDVEVIGNIFDNPELLEGEKHEY